MVDMFTKFLLLINVFNSNDFGEKENNGFKPYIRLESFLDLKIFLIINFNEVKY